MKIKKHKNGFIYVMVDFLQYNSIPNVYKNEGKMTEKYRDYSWKIAMST